MGELALWRTVFIVTSEDYLFMEASELLENHEEMSPRAFDNDVYVMFKSQHIVFPYRKG